MTIGVMVNGSELVGKNAGQQALQLLFPSPASESPVDLVRIACHVHEFAEALPAASWLKERGYDVGFNLMQIANCSESEIKALAKLANNYPLDVLYFADSMGSMSPDDAAQIIQWLRSEWQGALGIHTHDNLGLALSNTLRAMDEGVTWVDSTVTGMGRGPGNARTEELAIEIAARTRKPANLIPLMTLLREHFKPMQVKYGWGPTRITTSLANMVSTQPIFKKCWVTPASAKKIFLRSLNTFAMKAARSSAYIRLMPPDTFTVARPQVSGHRRIFLPAKMYCF